MPRTRSRLTFGTTLAVVLLLAAILLRPALDQFRQRGTMAAIERTGCRCQWEWAPSRPAWLLGRSSDLRKRWGDWIIGASVQDLAVEQQNLDAIKALPYLRRLELNIANLSRSSVPPVEDFLQLEGLGIRGDYRNPSLKIRRCHRLIFLRIEFAGDVEIADLPRLQELTLRDNDLLPGKRRLVMSGVPNLHTISAIQDSRLVDEGVFTLHDLPALESIYLNSVSMNSVEFAGLPNLRELEIRATQLNDAGVAKLSRLSELKSLKLVDCDLTDSGLAQIDGLPALETLDLSDTYVTPKGLSGLSRFPRLREVTTDRALTSEQQDELQHALPGVIINAPKRVRR